MQITDLRLAMDEAQAAVIAHKKESETRSKYPLGYMVAAAGCW